MHDFLLVQDPVEEGAGVVRDVDSPGLVDGWVQRELDALDEVEDDGVFETAGVGVVVVSEWRRVEDGGGWWRRVEEGGGGWEGEEVRVRVRARVNMGVNISW